MQPHPVISPSRCNTSAGDSREVKQEAEEMEESGNKGTVNIDRDNRPQLAPVQSQGMDETMKKAEGTEGQAEDEPEIHGTPEARVPLTLPEPHLLHSHEIAEHNRTHCPPRSWCPICTAAVGRETAHRSKARDTEGDDKVPTMGFDYNYTGDGNESVRKETSTRSQMCRP